ncbi:hypothetical protein C8J57DRAFT_1725258 [Mycena rebaudengoi]|nr:hypothetical protein C8J57DRAFT_1725258 [Mycena rebaudengoi]
MAHAAFSRAAASSVEQLPTGAVTASQVAIGVLLDGDGRALALLRAAWDCINACVGRQAVAKHPHLSRSPMSVMDAHSLHSPTPYSSPAHAPDPPLLVPSLSHSPSKAPVARVRAPAPYPAPTDDALGTASYLKAPSAHAPSSPPPPSCPPSPYPSPRPSAPDEYRSRARQKREA